MDTWLGLLIAMVSVVFGGLLAWVIGKVQQAHLLQELKNAVIDRERASLNEEFLMTQLLSDKIKDDNFKPDVIFAVCPGGAMIAEWLSRRFLGNRLTPTPVQLLFMVPKEEGIVAQKYLVEVDDKVTAIPSDFPKDSKVLLVNDISRGGHTLYAASEFLKKCFPPENIRSATLICGRQANVKPVYYVAVTDKNIRFDWKSYD